PLARLALHAFPTRRSSDLWLKAVNQYSLQAPFIFQFYSEVVLDDRTFYAFEEIEKLRSNLLHNNTEIEILDLGSGSVASPKSKRDRKSTRLNSSHVKISYA